MKPELWKRVEDLYYTVRVLPRGEQSAFLAKVCPDDEELRREVESLLNEPESPNGFLSRPAIEMAEHMDSNLPRAPVPMMTGRSIGGYQLQTLLGAGGMGEVYRSHDKKLGRDVAIKILPSGFANDPDRLVRFEREARMLAALNHPNICAIYGFEESEGIRFLVLELVEGETLRETLAGVPKGTGLPLRDALRIARQIADALEAAHEKGIIHRDLKPANIKITPHGVVKVLDFGLAKTVVISGSEPDVTNVRDATGGGKREGAVMGTAAYMSPEQARGLTVDKRTDIWAFGCVLYQMLTGRVPFAGDTGADTVAKILERDADWSALPAETPLHIRRLLLRCLIKDPRQRLRDIGDVRFEIDAIPEMRPEGSEIAVAAKSHTSWLPWVAFVALAAAVGVWEVQRPPATLMDLLADATVTHITDWPGDKGAADISRDGNLVTFLSNEGGEYDVYITHLGTDKFRNLTHDLASVGAAPFMVRSLGFNGDGSAVWLSPAREASNPQTAPKQFVPVISEGKTKTSFLVKDAEAPSWSPDGASVVFFKTDSGADILYVAADKMGAKARPILEHPPNMHNHNPVWSSDQWIYFVSGTEPTVKTDIWRIRPSGGSPEQMTHQNAAVNYLAVLDEHTLLYVAREEGLSGQSLWALDVASRVSRRLTLGLERITSVSASTLTRRVVITVANPSAALWQVPLMPAGTAREADVQRYPLKSERSLAPRFSKTSLFYLSAIGGGDALWRIQDGLEPSEYWRGPNVVLSEPAVVSRDGRVAVVVYDKRDNKRHLEIIPPDGGSSSATLPGSIDIQGAAGQGAADWSPDGKWIVAGVKDTSGPALFKIPVEGGDPVPLVKGPAFSPIWSPVDDLIVYSGDLVRGQAQLFGVRSDRTRVKIQQIADGKVADVFVLQGSYRFMPDGRLVFVPPSGSPNFWVLDLATRKSRQITQLSNASPKKTFDIAPDGKYIVFDRTSEHSDIFLIELPK